MMQIGNFVHDIIKTNFDFENYEIILFEPEYIYGCVLIFDVTIVI